MKKRIFHVKRKTITVFFLLILPLLLGISIGAEESVDTYPALPEEYAELLESLPDELRALLPSGLFSNDTEEVAKAIAEMSDISFLLRTLLAMVGLRLSEHAATLALIFGVLLLSAIARSIKTSLCTPALSNAFSLCTTLITTLCLVGKSCVGLASVTRYFESLSKMTMATLPLMGALYAMGGNVSAAVASTAGLGVFLTVIEELVAKSVLPFCGIAMAFALINAIEPSMRTGTFVATIKKSYATLLSFLMMLLIAMLTSQTTLAVGRDSLAMKSVKFAAGSWIPIVGGSVGELFRTVSASVGYLRGAVGLSGILLLLLMLLPTLVELFLARILWQLSASLADLLGCDGEKRLLEEFASILGYLIAAVSITSSVLLLAFSLLAHCASAIG